MSWLCAPTFLWPIPTALFIYFAARSARRYRALTAICAMASPVSLVFLWGALAGIERYRDGTAVDFEEVVSSTGWTYDLDPGTRTFESINGNCVVSLDLKESLWFWASSVSTRFVAHVLGPPADAYVGPYPDASAAALLLRGCVHHDLSDLEPRFPWLVHTPMDLEVMTNMPFGACVRTVSDDSAGLTLLASAPASVMLPTLPRDSRLNDLGDRLVIVLVRSDRREPIALYDLLKGTPEYKAGINSMLP